jgi:hypothetical protein
MMLNVTQTIAIKEGIIICTALRIQPYRVVRSVNDVFLFYKNFLYFLRKHFIS